MSKIFDKVKNMSLAAAALLTAGLMASCSQADEVADAPVDSTLRFEISDANVTRATTDGQLMVTTFEVGDAAGLYVVKDGVVRYENVKLTLSDLNVWSAEHPIAASAELAGATYYVYYPYSVNTTFDVTAAEPLKAYADGITPAANQSAKLDYEDADIMVGSTSAIGAKNTVSVLLQHQKALLYMELPNTSYLFDNEGMDPYALKKAENAVFMLGETEVVPYLDTNSQSYRLIVSPGEEQVLQVSFSYEGTKRSYTVSNLAAIAAGQYAKHIIDGGVNLTNYGTLQVGDYYCADGTLVSKDATAKPANAVGVVYKLGTTEAIQTASPYWTHGVVVSLDEVLGKWGTNKAPNDVIDASKTAARMAWNSWYTAYGMSQQNATEAASLDESLMAEEGYEVTQKWLSVPDVLTLEGETLDYTSVLKSTCLAWNQNHVLPANCNTGWYVPSLRDWLNIEQQHLVIDNSISSVGGTYLQTFDTTKYYYWTCNIRTAGLNWCYVLNATTLADRYKPTRCDYSEYYRFLLAF